MRTEYENMVKEFLPALRASAAKMMANEYKMSQMKIAKALNTTQAAVSKYLSGKYSNSVKRFEKTFERSEVETFVRNVVENSGYDAQRIVCALCSRNLSFRCRLMIK